MTIALGILAHDGVVIAADSEESYGDVKYHNHKIRGAFKITDQGGMRSMLMAGAGNAHHIDAFAEVLEEAVNRDPRIDTNPRLVFDQALERFYVSKVMPFSHYPLGERPDFSTVIGMVCGGRSHLFVSEYASLRAEEKPVVIGMGAMLARPMLSRYLGLYRSARGLSVRDAVVMAALAILGAKDGVQGVGKQSTIFAISNAMTHATVGTELQTKLDEVLRRYAYDLEPDVLRAVLGRGDAEKIAEPITALRKSIDSLLGNLFTDPKRPAVPPIPKSPKHAKKGQTP